MPISYLLKLKPSNNMKYKIVSANSTNDLTDSVMQHIEDGWIPLGGVSIVSHNFKLISNDDVPDLIVMQAMVFKL